MDNKYSKYSDRQLSDIIIESKKNGNTDVAGNAFTIIYNRYSSKVLAYCKLLINDNSGPEDIFQESFIRFYNNLGNGFSPDNIPGYLLRTARNLCYNYNRDKKKIVSIDNIVFRSEDGIKYENKELFELIITALELLDDKYKEAFVLRKFDGLSIREIADICGISVEGAKSRINRARLKLLEILEPYLKDLCK